MIMSKKITRVLILSLLFNITSCFELELENPNTVSEASFWKTENDLFQGVIAAYDALQLDGLYLGNLPVVLTGLSDDGTGESTNEFYAPFRFRIFNSNIFLSEYLWLHFYAMIGRSYQVIDRGSSVQGENVKNIQAEAKFLVALAYFNLIAVYGENIAFVDRIQEASDFPNELRMENSIT